LARGEHGTADPAFLQKPYGSTERAEHDDENHEAHDSVRAFAGGLATPRGGDDGLQRYGDITDESVGETQQRNQRPRPPGAEFKYPSNSDSAASAINERSPNRPRHVVLYAVRRQQLGALRITSMCASRARCYDAVVDDCRLAINGRRITSQRDGAHRRDPQTAPNLLSPDGITNTTCRGCSGLRLIVALAACRCLLGI